MVRVAKWAELVQLVWQPTDAQQSISVQADKTNRRRLNRAEPHSTDHKRPVETTWLRLNT